MYVQFTYFDSYQKCIKLDMNMLKFYFPGVLFARIVASKNQVLDALGWVITANVVNVTVSNIAQSAHIPTTQIVLLFSARNVTGQCFYIVVYIIYKSIEIT